MVSTGVHTTIWTSSVNARTVDAVTSGAAGSALDFVEIPLGEEPAAFETSAIRASLQSRGIGCTCSVGLPARAHAATAPDETVAFLDGAARTTAALGAEILTGEIYTHLGTFTGKSPEKRELVSVARALKSAARNAAKLGVSLGVQPVNRFENYLLNTAAQADELINRIGEPNVFAHLDTFHMNIEEKGFCEPVLRLGDRLKYVHLSESDRGTPGTGNVDWDTLFATLAEIGFKGRLVLESFVHPDPGMVWGAALWREVADDRDEPLHEGLGFLLGKAREHGLGLQPHSALR